MSMCPRGCGQHLSMAERQGIAIDYCPKCRGIWLDHGELEKFIELAEIGAGRVSAQPIEPRVPTELMPPRDSDYDRRSRSDSERYKRKDWDDDDDDYYERDKYGRKKSKLRTIFDIFD